MARTKQTARMSTACRAPRRQLAGSDQPSCQWSACYEEEFGTPHELPASRVRHTPRHAKDTISSKVMASFDSPKRFPQFIKLPVEIRHMIFDAIAQEPRTVSVRSKTNEGLRSSAPPILHVCSESRAIGLKYYTLAFGSETFLTYPEGKAKRTSASVYFNFERDTFYLRQRWNEGVDGPWSCLSRISSSVTREDLQRVKKVGIDVNARLCCLKTSGQYCPRPNFMLWKALETLYMGYEDGDLRADCPIMMSDLKSKDYAEFRRRYRLNPCWEQFFGDDEDDQEVIGLLRSEGARTYRVGGDSPEGSIEEMKLVSIKHL